MPLARIRDIEVFYEQHGAGEPLLLIHGLGSSTEDWEHQVPALSRGFRVITYDVRGHGRSAKPKEPYSVSQFAADAAALIAYLGLGRVHVVGISMGGMIALQLAADSPAVVRSLTIVNSGPELVLKTWKQRVAIYSRFAIVRLMGMRKMGEVLSKALLVGTEERHERARQVFVERWARNDPRAYLRSLRALIGWSVAERLAAIACPTLVLTADQDYTTVAFKQQYTARIPGARLAIVSDSRHMLPVEKPEEFNRVLLDFLASFTRGTIAPGRLPDPGSADTVRR